MARHVSKRMSEAFKKRSREKIAKLEREELPELLAKGQRVLERQERLGESLRALKAEREAQGVSLTEMERRTGITKASLSRLENAHNPNPTIGTLARIAAALGKRLQIVLEDESAAAA